MQKVVELKSVVQEMAERELGTGHGLEDAEEPFEKGRTRS